MCSVDYIPISIVNMEFDNTAHMSVSSYNVMDDGDLFNTKAAMDFFSMSGNFPTEDFVGTDPLWADGYASNGQAWPEQYHIDEGGSQALMDIQQSSTSSPQYESFGNDLDSHCRSKSNSAFKNYSKGTTKEVQLCFAPPMKQKLVKRCFDFLRRMHMNGRDESRIWEEKYCMADESYAVVHRIAERNRRNKLSQQFQALRSILPHSPKKVDKISTLTNAIMELNRQKLRIEELEQLKKRLTSAVGGNSMKSDGCSSLSDECVKDSTREALNDCICEEADVLVEETGVPDEAIIKVRMKRMESKCTYHMEGIVTVDKCLREIELEMLRIEWREVDSTNQVIEGTIRKKTKGERWETKEIQAVVKHALTGRWER